MKNKAVFLDRDGTIIEDRNYVYRIEDFIPLKNSVEGLKMLMNLGYLLVVISNQSGIARGYFSEAHLHQFFSFFSDFFSSHGIYFSGVYYCPHHPEGNIRQYSMECKCRKPHTGLFRQAIEDLEIDPKASFTIGDSMRDIIAGNRSGTKTILITKRAIHKNDSLIAKPDFTAADLLEAAVLIKNNSLQ